MNEALLIAFDALLAGISLLVSVLSLWLWHRDRRGTAQLWLGLTGLAAAVTFGSAAVVVSRPAHLVYETALFVRSSSYAVTTIFGVAALAALHPAPARRRVNAVIESMVALLVVRAVLWFSTDLIVVHPLRADEWPQWGPLVWTWVLFLLAPILTGVLGLRGSDPVLRRVVLAVFPSAAACAIWALVAGHGATAETAYTLSIVPGTVGSLVLGLARIERTSRSRERLVDRQSTLARLGQLATGGADIDVVREAAESQLRHHLGRADASIRVLPTSGDQGGFGVISVRGRHGLVRATGVGDPTVGVRDFVESLLQIVSAAADATVAEARIAAPVAATDDRPIDTRELDATSAQLIGAIGRGEFTLRYQPIVTAIGHVLVGYEALGRWSPGGRTVPAEQWVQAAERSGLIDAIGTHLLERACRDQPELGVPVSVNVSPMQLSTPQFVTTVRGALGPLAADRLVLEVTERLVVTDPRHTRATLEVLRRAGVRVALDDFGTSYSSLSMLMDLPVDVLKIDRSFVERLDSPAGRSVVEAVVTLARTLGKTTVAEGVENETQSRVLADLGVDTVQGFAIGRPVTLERVREGRARPRPVS